MVYNVFISLMYEKHMQIKDKYPKVPIEKMDKGYEQHFT